MKAKAAKIFSNGGSQAVRLPAEFRFEGDEVLIRRDEATGEVILTPKTAWASWDTYLAQRQPVPAEFLAERPLNKPLAPRKVF